MTLFNVTLTVPPSGKLLVPLNVSGCWTPNAFQYVISADSIYRDSAARRPPAGDVMSRCTGISGGIGHRDDNIVGATR